MKTWLKGGLIGLGIFVLLNIFFFLLPKGEFGNIGLLIITLLSIPLNLLFNLSSTCSYGGTCLGAIRNYIIFIIYFFLIGALIGWLVGKKKSAEAAK